MADYLDAAQLVVRLREGKLMVKDPATGMEQRGRVTAYTYNMLKTGELTMKLRLDIGTPVEGVNDGNTEEATGPAAPGGEGR